MPYTQGALALDGAAPFGTEQMSSAMSLARREGWTATLRHTLVPSGGRLRGDVWDEYRFECETRVRLHLPDVSLAEFRDMRDWTDCMKENNDDDEGIIDLDTDVPPYGYIGKAK
jgi:hypothetical protein